MGYRGYVTLIAWREDGFVFSGEELALVFQFQSEELTLLRSIKRIIIIIYCCIICISTLNKRNNLSKKVLTVHLIARQHLLVLKLNITNLLQRALQSVQHNTLYS